MPIKKPKDGETQQEYVSECIADLTKNKKDEFPSRAQRAAICYSEWERKDKPPKKK